MLRAKVTLVVLFAALMGTLVILHTRGVNGIAFWRWDWRALAPARGVDRGGVGVEAVDGRRRERLGHEDRRGAVAAADVGDARAALELGDDAVERRQP
jgi:hypothetical protein